MRPLNNPFLGEKGRAAFGPTWKRAAAFMWEATEREPVVMLYLRVVSPEPSPLGSVAAGWRYFQPHFPPLHLTEQRGDV